jgi:hypothetical protein
MENSKKLTGFRIRDSRGGRQPLRTAVRRVHPDVVATMVVAAVTVACSVKVREAGFQREAEQGLRGYYEQELEGSWIPSSDIEYVSLGQRDTVPLTVMIEGGQVAGVLGSCDDDCVDLNIDVFDSDGFRVPPETGGPGTDKYPFAQFTAEDSTTYRVRIGMAECIDEPCSVAYWVMRDRSGSGQAVSELVDYFGDQRAAGWAASSIIQTSNLGHRQSVRRSRVFQRGRTAGALAVCDSTCVDLDIQVFDADGFRVPIEEEAPRGARFPFVSFRVEETGTYDFQFGMAECKRDPCAFAFLLVEKEEAD